MNYKNLILAIFCCFLTANSFAAETPYTILSEKNLLGDLGVFRHIQWNEKEIEFYAVTLNGNYQAEIYQQPAQSPLTAESIRKIVKNKDMEVGINGGFYSKTFEPVGLFIQKGEPIKKLANSALLTSCIKVDNQNKITLEKNRANCTQSFSAMQAASFLIDQGEISEENSKLAKKLNSLKEYFTPHRRTTVAEANDKKIILITSGPITLEDMAIFLKNYPNALGVTKIMNALSLDGGSSTGMFVQLKADSFYNPEIKPVKTFLLIK